MAIELRTFASGDTDYIAKLNENVSTLTAAINSLQAQAGGAAGAGSPLSVGQFMDALFNSTDGVVGTGSFKVTQHATTVTVAEGTMYLAGEQVVVVSYLPLDISFVGQTAGTYYIVVGAGGTPVLQATQTAGTVYSVQWSGSAFIGEPVRIAPVFFDTAEADASRKSTAVGAMESPPEVVGYLTLDERLEAMEGQAVGGGGAVVRKIGITVDGTTGIKGAIQIDFAGTIIGWSAVADASGNLTVEVDRKASSDPPAAPAIPNTTTDKISASAPIALAGAQSAARDEAGVSTWNRNLAQWDVVQFNVTVVTGITRATLYLRIQEDISSP